MRVIREQEWDGGQYDWHWTTPKGPFDGLVVPARKLVSALTADIVAVWLDDTLGRPVYLVGRDGELYCHHEFDEILEQHFPAGDFLRWSNSWGHTNWPFMATEQFPEGWRYMWCYPYTNKNIILIREDLWKDFSDVVKGHAYKNTYKVSCDFPFLVDETLDRLEHIKP